MGEQRPDVNDIQNICLLKKLHDQLYEDWVGTYGLEEFLRWMVEYGMDLLQGERYEELRHIYGEIRRRISERREPIHAILPDEMKTWRD